MRSMTAREYDDWKRFEALEPFPEERADWRIGMLASVIANANRDPSKKPEPFLPEDFMLDFSGVKKPELSRAEQAQQIAQREADAELVYAAKIAALAEMNA